MINRETVWDETYRKQSLYPGPGVNIDVLTAIHHNRIASSLSLVQRISIDINSQPGSARLSVELDSHQMRQLAAYLNHAANRAEELQQQLDAELIEQAPLEVA